MTALMAWLWLRERATRRTIWAAVLAMSGVAVTVAGSMGGGKLPGDALALLMAVAVALMTVLARRQKTLPALVTACVCSLVGALAVLPLGLALGVDFAVGWRSLAWLAAFGTMSMAIALPCYLSGAARIPSGQAMLISALELPLAPLWVWLAFGEVAPVASLIGGGVVALAIVWQLLADT